MGNNHGDMAGGGRRLAYAGFPHPRRDLDGLDLDRDRVEAMADAEPARATAWDTDENDLLTMRKLPRCDSLDY